MSNNINNSIAIIYKPHMNDVLLCRKIIADKHAGNQLLNQITAQKTDQYKNAFYREQKKMIIQDIIDEIKNLQPAGRFLEPTDKSCSEWYEVDSEKCVNKIYQTLREQAKLNHKSCMQDKTNTHRLRVSSDSMSLNKPEQKMDTSTAITNSPILPCYTTGSHVKVPFGFKEDIRFHQNIKVLSQECKGNEKKVEKNVALKPIQDLNINRSKELDTCLPNRHERPRSLKKRILYRRRDSENAGTEGHQIDDVEKKRNLQSHELEISKKLRNENVNKMHEQYEQIIIPITFIGEAFLANPVFSANSRCLFENIVDLGDDDNGMVRLPSVVTSLCNRIEELEGSK